MVFTVSEFDAPTASILSLSNQVGFLWAARRLEDFPLGHTIIWLVVPFPARDTLSLEFLEENRNRSLSSLIVP